MFKRLFFLCLLLPFTCFSYEGPFLVEHLKNAISQAQRGKSKLTPEVLAIEGQSSPKVRHLLNQLCTLDQASYLEIGCWKGSTWVSALYGNEKSVAAAIAIDNWMYASQNDFKANCDKFLKRLPYLCISADCFAIKPEVHIKRGVNVYFYDGAHGPLDQERAFTHYNEVFEKVFIAIVDDYNVRGVQKGTQSAIEKLGYTVHYAEILPAAFNGDTLQWWNGLYVAVLEKK